MRGFEARLRSFSRRLEPRTHLLTSRREHAAWAAWFRDAQVTHARPDEVGVFDLLLSRAAEQFAHALSALRCAGMRSPLKVRVAHGA